MSICRKYAVWSRLARAWNRTHPSARPGRAIAPGVCLGLALFSAARADHVVIWADSSRLAEISRLAAPVELILPPASGVLPILRATVLEYRTAPAPDGYEITVRAWAARPEDAPPMTPIPAWSEPFVLRGREIRGIQLAIDDVFDLRVLLSDVDRHTGGFDRRWYDAVSALVDRGPGGALGLSYHAQPPAESLGAQRLLKGTLIEHLLNPPSLDAGAERPRPVPVVPAWQETLQWDVRHLGRHLASARATLVLWPDAEARTRRLVPALNAAVQWIASLGRLPRPPLFSEDGKPLPLRPLERRRVEAVALSGWLFDALFQSVSQACYPGVAREDLTPEARARLHAEIDAIDDPYVRERQGIRFLDSYTDSLGARRSRLRPWADSLEPGGTRLALAALEFFADCPELWGQFEGADANRHLVRSLIALAGEPRSPTTAGEVVRLPTPQSSDPDRGRLESKAQQVLLLLLRPDLDHPALQAVPSNDRATLEDRIRSAAVARRSAFELALLSDEPWILLNAIELFEKWSTQPGRQLVNQAILDDLISIATSHSDHAPESAMGTHHRFRQQIAFRVMRTVLQWRDGRHSPGERRLAGHLVQRIDAMGDAVQRGQATAGVATFIQRLNQDNFARGERPLP